MTDTGIDIPLLQKTLDWAYNEWQKEQRGEVSEWDQRNWMTSATNALAYKLYRLKIDNQEFRNGASDLYQEAEREAKETGASTDCGSACCIAGKIVLEAGYKPILEVTRITTTRWVTAPDNKMEMTVSEAASKELGLGLPTTYQDLFDGENTIYDLYRIANRMTNGQITVPPDIQGAYLNEWEVKR